MVTRGWFDNIVLLFIALNCITLAMERPNIPPDSKERAFLSSANYVFTVVFAVEMFIKVRPLRNCDQDFVNFTYFPGDCIPLYTIDLITNYALYANIYYTLFLLQL